MKAFKEVTLYMSADGRLHKTPKEAAKHTENEIATGIKKILANIDSPNITLADRTIVLLTLMEHRVQLRELLAREVAFEDESEE